MDDNTTSEKYYKIHLKPGTHLSDDKDHDGIQKSLQFSYDGNAMQGPVDLEEVFTDLDLQHRLFQQAQIEREYDLYEKALKREQIRAYSDLLHSGAELIAVLHEIGVFFSR